MADIQELFNKETVVVNVGLKLFGQALQEQDVKVLQVDWKPEPVLEEEMRDILSLVGGF